MSDTTSSIETTESVASASVPQDELSREQAINDLAAEAFLSFANATCVIDALYDKVGTYNYATTEAMEGADQPALIAACTDPSSTAATAGAGVVIREVEVATVPTPNPLPLQLTAELMPAISPGALTSGSVVLNGTNVDYVTITPPGFEIGSQAPVFIALPPGGQDFDITQNVAEFIYLQQAVDRGWVVVSPASPGGLWYETGNVGLMPELIRWVEAWVTVEGGRPHLGGMSNGGRSAFAIATQYPDGYRSLLVYPGAADVNAVRRLDRLAAMPVRMWVGGEDAAWLDPMQAIATELIGVGGDVSLVVLPGEPHVIQSITDGQAIFDALDEAR